MAKQIFNSNNNIKYVDIGSIADDGTGDDLRTAFDKINDNFAYITATQTEDFKYINLLDVPEDYQINTIVSTNEFGNAVIHRQFDSEDIVVSYDQSSIHLSLSPNLANVQTFANDVYFQKNIHVMGNTIVQDTYINIEVLETENRVVITNTDPATDTVTGALQVSGGAGISGAVHAASFHGQLFGAADITDLTVTDSATILCPVVANSSITAANFIGPVTGTVSSLANHTTNSLAEGSNNLYYTTQRWDQRFATKTTDNLPEGSTNFYFRPSLVRTSITATEGITYNSITGELKLTDSGVTAGTYGNANAIPSVTLNSKGQVTAITTSPLPPPPPTTLDGLTDVVLSGVTSGQVLQYDGTNWVNQTVSGGGGGSGGSGNMKTITYVTDGTWVAPAGVSNIEVELWGGGAGGSATGHQLPSDGISVGGNGGYGRAVIPVTPGTSYAITVGRGGTGWILSTRDATNGTNTSFGSLATATGGQIGGVDGTFSIAAGEVVRIDIASIVAETSVWAGEGYSTLGVDVNKIADLIILGAMPGLNWSGNFIGGGGAGFAGGGSAANYGAGVGGKSLNAPGFAGGNGTYLASGDGGGLVGYRGIGGQWGGGQAAAGGGGGQGAVRLRFVEPSAGGGSSGGGIGGVQVFSTSGSFTVPSGITKLLVTAFGGGGGGTYASEFYGYTGIGGNGGQGEAIITVTPGEVITVTVGAGGNGGGGSPGGFFSATAGGTTSFGSYATATGGSAGQDGSVQGTFSTTGTIIRKDFNLNGGSAGGITGAGEGGGPSGGGGGGMSGGGGAGGVNLFNIGAAGGKALGPGNDGATGGATSTVNVGSVGGSGGGPLGGTGAPGWYSAYGGGGGGGGGGVIIRW